MKMGWRVLESKYSSTRKPQDNLAIYSRRNPQFVVKTLSCVIYAQSIIANILQISESDLKEPWSEGSPAPKACSVPRHSISV